MACLLARFEASVARWFDNATGGQPKKKYPPLTLSKEPLLLDEQLCYFDFFILNTNYILRMDEMLKSATNTTTTYTVYGYVLWCFDIYHCFEISKPYILINFQLLS